MNSENELQEKVERGLPVSGRDAEVYQQLFRVLAREKEISLSADFAEIVAKRVTSKERKRVFLEEHLLLLISVLSVLAGAAYCLMKTDASFSLGFLSGMSDYAGVFSFGIALILVLNFFEKRLISRRIGKKLKSN
jgi:hypothetical protein